MPYMTHTSSYNMLSHLSAVRNIEPNWPVAQQTQWELQQESEETKLKDVLQQ